MNTATIKSQLTEYDSEKVDIYVNYLTFLSKEKKKENNQWLAEGTKNPWLKFHSETVLAGYFKSVTNDGLDFDGKHITLQSTGVSYDYIAYKNKMLLAYPESLIDLQLVHEGDEFAFKKVSGKVEYTHRINDAFGERPVVGGYCVIKNGRGEFLTLLSTKDIDKHKKVAKTLTIWNAWPDEMKLKTLIKKACKIHFEDIYTVMETLDNEQNDLELPLTISVQTKDELEAIEDVQTLNKYYKDNISKNAGHPKDFIKACEKQKAVIVQKLSEAADAKATEENADT